MLETDKNSKEWKLIEKTVSQLGVEQRRSRRWGIFFKLLTFMYLFGLLILLNSVSSPYYLLDGRHIGDGATLATMTFIPEMLWVFIWFSIAVLALYSLYKSSKK